MLDELVAHFVDRTAKEGSFFFWRDDVVDVLVEPGIEGIAELAVQRLLAFFAVFGAEGLRGGVGRLRRSVGVEWERRKKAEDERRAKESHAATSKKSSK